MMHTNDKQGIFVIGCPRSGTYLLSTLLTKRFGVALPLETHFIPLFSRFLPLWGDLKQEKNRKTLMNDVLDFLTIWAWASRELDCQEDTDVTLLGIRDMAEKIVQDSESFGGMITGMFSEFAASQGMEHWADKSAFFHQQPLSLFQRAVPNLKVIHCIRDPRDVVMSWQRIWCGPKTVTEAALAWQEHVRAYRKWGHANSHRYFEFRFEDLLADPEDMLRKLAVFLELPLLDEGESPDNGRMAQTLGKLKTHTMVGGKIQSDNKEKWRTKMAPEDIALVEWLTRDTIREFGYPMSGDGTMPENGMKRRILEQIRENVSLRRVQLFCKDILPLCLRIRSLTGIPLPKKLFRLEGRADCAGR